MHLMYRRWLIIVVCFPMYVLFMAVLAVTLARFILAEWPTDSVGECFEDVWQLLTDSDFFVWVVPITGALAIAQMVFVIPVVAKTPPRGDRPRSLMTSLLIAGAIAGVLFFGAGAALADAMSMIIDNTADPADKEWLWLVAITTWLAGWGFWTILLVVFTREIWADRALGRATGLLLGGTVLEIIAVIPIDLMVRRRTDCYCATGTMITLLLSTAATLWLVGPGIVIAIMSPRHRMWRKTHCERCGYARGPSKSERCPECGMEWAKKTAASAPSLPEEHDADASKGE